MRWTSTGRALAARQQQNRLASTRAAGVTTTTTRALWASYRPGATSPTDMDRFAFLASQPWLYPPPDDVASAPCVVDDARVSVVADDGVHRFIPAHLLLDADFGGVLRTPPARGRVAHHHHHTDLSVVFDGCASFHFSEREQYGHPPVPPRADRDVGTPGVVGAAASDALHMAFAPTDECPDQAQFACRVRARRCERVQPDAEGGRTAARDFRRDHPDAAWLEITVDGFARAVDLSQARRVVVGPPIEAPRPDPRRREPETVLDRRARRLDRRRRRRRRRRRGRDARREFAVRDPNDPDDSDDDEESYPYDCDDDESPFGASGNRAAHVDADVDGVFDRRLTALTANAPRRAQTPVGDDSIDDARAEAGETPYVSVVFSHVTLNLYHDAGLLGCRRASPGGEREKIAAVRDALERFREAATGGAEGRARDRGRSARRSSDATSSRDTPRGVSSAQPPPEESSPSFGATARPEENAAAARKRLRARAEEVRAAAAAAIAARRELERALVAATRRVTTTRRDETNDDDDDEWVERDFGRERGFRSSPDGDGNDARATNARRAPTKERRLAVALTRAARRSAETLEETRAASARRSRRARRVASALDEAERDADERAAADATWRDELARMRGWTDEATLVESGERAPSADELGEARFA